jgi:hypothetical protein
MVGRPLLMPVNYLIAGDRTLYGLMIRCRSIQLLAVLGIAQARAGFNMRSWTIRLLRASS